LTTSWRSILKVILRVSGTKKPDSWEEYDESEALVKRSRDLNFDGEPDLKKMAGEKVSKTRRIIKKNGSQRC